MTLLVVDASAALAWMLPSQASAAADRLLAQRTAYELVVPSVFHWEVRNALLVLDRRPTAPSGAYDLALEFLDRLEVRTAAPLTAPDVRELAVFARAQRLSLFDASYMGLALEESCELASRDAALLEAAGRVGITALDLRGEPSR